MSTVGIVLMAIGGFWLVGILVSVIGGVLAYRQVKEYGRPEEVEMVLAKFREVPVPLVSATAMVWIGYLLWS